MDDGASASGDEAFSHSTRPKVVRSSELVSVATRRPGISERRLMGPGDNLHQNWVLIDAESGALVEEHVVENSESFFLLSGSIQVFGPGFEETLSEGDFCGFAPGAAHGVRVLDTARFLVVFAPAITAPRTSNSES